MTGHREFTHGMARVRVEGLRYTCTPGEKTGPRISDKRLNSRLVVAADKTYKVAGWAPVAEGAKGATGTQAI